jgi:hypothetical protein
VCPSCTGRAGGQTADFGGIRLDCQEQARPLTEQLERELELAELRAQLQGPVDLDGRWSTDTEVDSALPSEVDTAITLEVELGELTYFTSIGCGEWVEGPVSIMVRVGDGVLSAQATGVLRRARGAMYARVRAAADLSETTGTLSLEVDSNRLHVGELQVMLSVFAGAVRGRLEPTVWYFEDEDELMAWAEADDTVVVRGEELMQLRFPVDDCEDNALPLVLDQPSAWLGDQVPSELLAAAREHILDQLQFEGRRDDGAAVSLSLDWPAVEIDGAHACFGEEGTTEPWSGPSRGVEVSGGAGARLLGDDGRVELDFDRTVLLVGAAESEPRHLSFGAFVTADAPGLLERGFPLENEREGTFTAWADVDFDLSEAPKAWGEMHVVDDESGDSILCLGWPGEDACR